MQLPIRRRTVRVGAVTAVQVSCLALGVLQAFLATAEVFRGISRHVGPVDPPPDGDRAPRADPVTPVDTAVDVAV